MKLSIIGLGAMGYPMARHLAGAHDVVVWNRTTEVAARHSREHGTRIAESLEACADADVVMTILPTSREVDQIVDAIADRLKPGTFWVDVTSGDPASSRATARRLRASSISYADTPVSGGPVGAEAAALTVMVGCAENDFSKVEEILRSCAKKIIRVGEVGAGHTIKAVTNTVMAANLLVAAEAMVALKKEGFDMSVALDVLNGSSGRSNVSENLLPQRLLHGEWPLLFKLALLDKDVRIATEILHDAHGTTPMIALAGQLITAARKQLGEGADYIEVCRYVAANNGTSVG